MSNKTLLDFLQSNMLNNRLNLYEVELEVHGYLWFHTMAIPSPLGWIHQVAPVIHNYSLVLGFLGRLVEESYANEIGEPQYKLVRRLVRENKVYIYPATIIRSIPRQVQFTGIGEGHVSIRGKTRLTYPDRGFNTLLLPGTTLKTYILAHKEFQIPNYIRIGAKRTGLLKVVEKNMLEYNIDGEGEITHPANSFDSELIGEGLVILKHKGGNIITFTKAKKTIVATRRTRQRTEKVVLAYPSKLWGIV